MIPILSVIGGQGIGDSAAKARRGTALWRWLTETTKPESAELC